MSDSFIPLNQSTPVHGNFERHQQRGHWNQKYQNRRSNNFNRSNRWGNNSHHSNSFGSDHNNSSGSGIDAYLHPSMLQDPWAHLRSNK